VRKSVSYPRNHYQQPRIPGKPYYHEETIAWKIQFRKLQIQAYLSRIHMWLLSMNHWWCSVDFGQVYIVMTFHDLIYKPGYHGFWIFFSTLLPAVDILNRLYHWGFLNTFDTGHKEIPGLAESNAYKMADDPHEVRNSTPGGAPQQQFSYPCSC